MKDCLSTLVVILMIVGSFGFGILSHIEAEKPDGTVTDANDYDKIDYIWDHITGKYQKEHDNYYQTKRFEEAKRENESRRANVLAFANKIRSQKTNRRYSDGFNSTPIYNDDNGRDYIIIRNDNGTANIVYLDNGQKRPIDQAVQLLVCDE